MADSEIDFVQFDVNFGDEGNITAVQKVRNEAELLPRKNDENERKWFEQKRLRNNLSRRGQKESIDI